MFKIKTVCIVPAGIICCLFFSCSNSSSKKESESAELAAQEARQGVLRGINEAGLNLNVYARSAFQEDAVHDISLIPSYIVNGNKSATALILGLFMSDLGYVNAFGKPVETQRFFEGCFLLANDIGMKKQFEHAIDLQFADILSGKQNLSPSQEKILNNAENRVDSAEFKKLHAAALAGFYIEELYHMVIYLESSAVADSLVMQTFQILMSQRQHLNNLVGYFDHLPMKPEGIALYMDILKLQEKYQEIDPALLSKAIFPAARQDEPYADILASIKIIRGKITIH